MWSLNRPVRTMPLASWPEGLKRIICSPLVGGFHSRSAPARVAIHGSQAVVSDPVFTCTRGGFIWTAAMVPRRMRFSMRRVRVDKLVMAPMLTIQIRACSLESLYAYLVQLVCW